MEAELLFALLLAHLRQLRPRRRTAFLRDVCEIVAAWEGDALPIRGDGKRADARKSAAIWVRENLPRLLA